MDKDLIIKLFKEYYGETFDIDGLVMYLVDVEKERDCYDFFFNFDNPNDVSYFYSLIADIIDEIVSDFSKYISIETTRGMVNFSNSQPRLYLDRNLKNKVKNVFKKMQFIEFNTWIGNSEFSSKFRIYGESIGIKLHWDSDSYSIVNKFNPISATLDGEVVELSYAIQSYDDFLSDKETYWETENIYSEVDSFFSERKYPLLVNDAWIALYVDTEF